MGEAPVVHLDSFGKLYGKKRAVGGAQFGVQKGTLYGLIGPDAAGKSSILKAISGVLSFEEGSLDVFGVTIDSERAGEQIKGRIGFMPQGLGLNLYAELTADENVDYFADLRLVPRSKYVNRKEEFFRITRLSEFRDRRMKNLSGGMKQKLGLICALIHDPELLILDEPTTGVDPVSRRDFWSILSHEIHQRGITAIVSTAYMDEAARFDRICLFHDGAQLAEGTPNEVIGRLPGTMVSLSCEDQLEALRRLRTIFARADSHGDVLRVRVDAPAEEAVRQVQEKLADLHLKKISSDEATLEDTFVFMLGEKESEDIAGLREGTALKREGEGEEAIIARRLTKSYDEFVAVDRVNLTVKRGQIFGLLGANGAGKTTVIKMLTGIVPPTHGQGQVAGADMRRGSLEVKRRIGYVSQAYSLYQDLTVRENILLYAGIYGLGPAKARERAAWVVEFGGLQDYVDSKSGSLPIGLRQRLALGCALVHEPQVLFLDEPTSGVDPLGRRTMWDLLFRLSREQAVAILVTTHYMSEAEHCDQLALMHAGRIVANASPAQLKQEFREEAGALLEIDVSDIDKAEEILATAQMNPTLYGRFLHVLVQGDVSSEARMPIISAEKHEKTVRESQRGCPTVEGVLRLLKANALSIRSAKEVPITMEDVFVFRISQLEQGRIGEVAA